MSWACAWCWCWRLPGQCVVCGSWHNPSLWLVHSLKTGLWLVARPQLKTPNTPCSCISESLVSCPQSGSDTPLSHCPHIEDKRAWQLWDCDPVWRLSTSRSDRGKIINKIYYIQSVSFQDSGNRQYLNSFISQLFVCFFSRQISFKSSASLILAHNRLSNNTLPLVFSLRNNICFPK